jgi:chromosome segregation ATPase
MLRGIHQQISKLKCENEGLRAKLQATEDKLRASLSDIDSLKSRLHLLQETPIMNLLADLQRRLEDNKEYHAIMALDSKFDRLEKRLHSEPSNNGQAAFVALLN